MPMELKKGQSKSNISGRKEITIRAEVSELQIRKTIENMNETKRFLSFFALVSSSEMDC